MDLAPAPTTTNLAKRGLKVVILAADNRLVKYTNIIITPPTYTSTTTIKSQEDRDCPITRESLTPSLSNTASPINGDGARANIIQAAVNHNNQIQELRGFSVNCFQDSDITL